MNAIEFLMQHDRVSNSDQNICHYTKKSVLQKEAYIMLKITPNKCIIRPKKGQEAALPTTY